MSNSFLDSLERDSNYLLLEKNKEYEGFTFYLSGKDYYIITNRDRKTEKMCIQVLEKLGHKEISKDLIDDLRYRMKPATMQIKSLENGRSYYDIHGDGFGGNGGFLDENKTVVMTIDD